MAVQKESWYRTRVSLEFALNYGCFAPARDRIPYNDRALRDVAYGKCIRRVNREMNLQSEQYVPPEVENG
jgi:hypothetical protein